LIQLNEYYYTDLQVHEKHYFENILLKNYKFLSNMYLLDLLQISIIDEQKILFKIYLKILEKNLKEINNEI
jgi:hypothetical protein